MKAISIDSASSCLTVTAMNDDNFSSISLDIGSHQSEKIIPLIQNVLSDVNLECSDIEFACLCKGPGTFTGLRLAFAALKGIQLTYRFPIYGIDSLENYANPLLQLGKTVISCLDAKKHRFYVSIYRNGKNVVESCDTEIAEIKKFIDEEEDIILTGPDAVYFSEQYATINPNQKFIIIESKNINTGYQLLEIGKKNFEKGLKGIEEYDGPSYIRPSEAEEGKTSI